MDDATNTQKGFLVKRADGTTARLSLDEIKRRAARKEKEEVEETVEETASDAPAEISVELPPPPTPQIIRERLEQKEKKIEPVQKKWSKDDHVSPLEEDIEAHEIKDVDVQGYNYDRIVDEIMQDIPMSIAPALQPRTRKMFLSLVRGTRDRHSFHELAEKKPEDGGLGMSAEDAARLVVVAMDKKHGHDKKIKHSFKPAKLPKAAAVEPGIRKEQVYGALATTTPVRDYFKDVAQAKASATPRIAPAAVAHTVPPRAPSKAIGKQLMHDLRAPEGHLRKWNVFNWQICDV